MGLQGYVGSAEDQRRIRRQEKEREEKKKQFEKAKQQSDANVDGSGLRQFGAGTSETLEAAFKIETVGLVTREEFLSKRETLKDRMDEAKAQAKREADKALNQEKLERSRKKAKLAAKTKLSFGGDDEEEGDAKEATEAAGVPDKEAPGKVHQADKDSSGAQQAAPRKLGKDPTAQTDFLPDHEREAQEVAVREQLRKEYELRQKLMKNEPLKITYSYWDGQGHRRTLTIRKGDTIAQFLQKVKEQLHADFRELRQDFSGMEPQTA
ncbi:g10655 [Coccomyxa elongata]